MRDDEKNKINCEHSLIRWRDTISQIFWHRMQCTHTLAPFARTLNIEYWTLRWQWAHNIIWNENENKYVYSQRVHFNWFWCGAALLLLFFRFICSFELSWSLSFFNISSTVVLSHRMMSIKTSNDFFLFDDLWEIVQSGGEIEAILFWFIHCPRHCTD